MKYFDNFAYVYQSNLHATEMAGVWGPSETSTKSAILDTSHDFIGLHEVHSGVTIREIGCI